MKGNVDLAMEKLKELWDQGYSAVDIIVTIFRVVKTFDECVNPSFVFRFDEPVLIISMNVPRMPEYTKLEYIKVSQFISLFLGRGKDAFVILNPELPSDMIEEMKNAWIGGVCLAGGTAFLFVVFVNVFIHPPLPEN